ncbi:hypothetical protein ACRAWG_03485 [Methylobacterium sp. P31]
MASVPASAKVASAFRAATEAESPLPTNRDAVEVGPHRQVVGAGEHGDAVSAREDLEIDEAAVLRVADGALRRRGDHRDPLAIEVEPRRRAGPRQGERHCDTARRVGFADGIDRVARAQRFTGRQLPGHPAPG